MKSLTSKAGGTLGFAFFFGLAISLWSANAGMKAMFDALNVVYDEDEKRGFIKLNLQALLFTLGALLFLLLALAAVAVIPVVLKLFPFARLVEQLLSILRWPILAGGVLLGLAVLYRYGPSDANCGLALGHMGQRHRSPPVDRGLITADTGETGL